MINEKSEVRGLMEYQEFSGTEVKIIFHALEFTLGELKIEKAKPSNSFEKIAIQKNIDSIKYVLDTIKTYQFSERS